METVNQPSPRCASFQNTAVLLAKNCVSLILQYAVGTRGFVFRGYDAACAGEDFLPTLREIRQRFADIIAQLQLQVDLTADFKTIASHLRSVPQRDYMASRGEYLNSKLLAADPRIVENPRIIDYITYRELRELSYMGASVLHEDAVFPVRQANIPINVRNTNRPSDSGTFIVSTLPPNVHKRKVTGIAGHKGFSSVYVEKSMMNGEIGFVAKLLNIFVSYGISFDHCPSGIDTVSIIVSTSALVHMRNEILHEIETQLHPDKVSIEDDLTLIAIVGQGMISTKGTAAHIFHIIADANINIRMIDQSSNELNIIIAVSETEYELAVQSLYHAVERAV